MTQLKKWLNSVLAMVLVLSMLAPAAAVDASEMEQENSLSIDTEQINNEAVTSGDSTQIEIPTIPESPVDTELPLEAPPEDSTSVVEKPLVIEGAQTAKPTVDLVGYKSGETVTQPNQVVDIVAKDSLGNTLSPVVKLNGVEIQPNTEGKYDLALKTGNNTVRIEATDNENQKTTKSWTLKFEAMTIEIANYGEQRVFHEPLIKVDFDVKHYDEESVIPVVTRSDEAIEINEDGLFELHLTEGLNVFKVEATDSKGYAATMNYAVNYSRIQVIDFMPGVGQFINSDAYTKDVETKVRSKGGSLISLGGFGGYVTIKYDEPIKNDPNNPYGIDFTVVGNPFAINGFVDVYNNEPAGVMVAQHENGPWYHLAGSEYENEDTIKNYELTYHAPTAEESSVVWVDNVGGTGKIAGKNYPAAERFPKIPTDKYTVSGVAIFNDVLAADIGTVRKQVRYGYADAVPPKNTNYETPNNPYAPGIQGSGGDAMDISWAVDENGNPVYLEDIQYVKVYTAVNKVAGALGEISPEVKDFGRSVPIDSTVDRITIKNLENTNWVPNNERLQFYLEAFDVSGNETAYPEVEWSSSNSEVAKVNKVSGQVHTFAEGQATITAKLKNNPAISAQFELTVKSKSVPNRMELTTTGTTFLASGSLAAIYTATIYDQYNNLIQGEDVEWSVTDAEKFTIVAPFNNDKQKISLKPTNDTGVHTLTAKLGDLQASLIITVGDASLTGTASNNGSVTNSALSKLVDTAVTKNSEQVYFRVTNSSTSRTGDVVNFNNDALTYAKEKNKKIAIEGREYRFILPAQLVADNDSKNKLRFTSTITESQAEVVMAASEETVNLEAAAALKQVGKALTIQLDQVVGTTATPVEQLEAAEAAIKFTPEEVKDVDVKALAAHLQLTDGTWKNVGGTFNEATYELTFSAANPGKYAVFEVSGNEAEPIVPEEKAINVSVRVEGYDKTILREQLQLTAYDISNAVGNAAIPTSGSPLAIHAIVKAFEQAQHDVTDAAQFNFGGGSYITKLAGLATGSVSPGLDGWMYAVNNMPAPVGVDQQKLSDGDEIVVYFVTDYTKNAYSYLTVKQAKDKQYEVQLLGVSYDANTGGQVENPVSDATIVIDGVESSYKTDANGIATLQFTSAGKHELTAVKKGEKYSVISRPYLEVDVTEEVVPPTDDITVSVRVEGFDKTILPKTSVQLSAFDLTDIVTDQQLAESYKTDSTTFAIHAIVKAFKDAGYDVKDKGQFDFGDGSYFTKLAGLSATTAGGWMYAVNNTSPLVGAGEQTLQNNDEVVVYFVEDWTLNNYSYLKLRSIENNNYKFQLLGLGYDENWQTIVVPISDATIIINGVESKYKTDGNGYVTLPLDKANSHELTAVKKAGKLHVISRPYFLIDGNEQIEEEIPETKPEEPETPVVPPSQVTPLVEQTTSYLLSKTPVATFGSEWNIISLARSHVAVPQSYYDNYLADVAAALKQGNGTLEGPPTEQSRLILALSAIGVDATNVGGYNVYAPLHDFDQVIAQGINGSIFALLAFNAQNYNPSVAQLGRVASLTDVAATNVTTREKLVDYIVSKELAGGGFALAGTKADPDLTAMALQALAPYKKDAEVAKVIERSVTQLASIQLANAGYTSAGNENVQSAAQVLIALSTLQIDAVTDPRFIKNDKTILDNIQSFAIGDGGYKHPKNGAYNAMATQQAAQALVAYDRFAKGLPGLFEMADVTIEEKPIPENPGGSTGGGGGGSTAPVEPTEQVAYIAITNKSYGDILTETEVKLNKGDTVFSILKRITGEKDIALNTRSSSYGKYVAGIAGIREFDRGPLSGWMYRANGDFPSYSSDSHRVNAGDYIEWVYTEDLGQDIGGYVPGIETNPGTGAGGGAIQKPTTPGETEQPSKPTVKDEKLQAAITAAQVAELKNAPFILKDNAGGKVEIPAALLKSIQLKDNEVLHVAVTQQEKQIQVTLEKEAGGKKTQIVSGKNYVKVTLPVTATANTVVLQLVDGELKAVPHKVVNNEMVLFVKGSGTFIVSEEAVTFNDIAKLANKEDIEFLASRHVIKGKEADRFAPNDKVTRAQFAALVSRALGLQANEASNFTDTKGKWYESDVQALFEAGITTGKTATTFDPGANMTREQGAAFMARILTYTGYDAAPAPAVTFTDDASINKAYKENIALLVSLGIMSGKEDGSFDAKGNLTRGQLAKMLKRTLTISGLM